MLAHKILLVEDEDLIRLLLSEALVGDGFIVNSAATGEEALDLIARDVAFDVLFTDIQLPGRIDGLDVAREVRERFPEIPIVFTTGQPDRMSDWVIGPIDVFIPKPYRPAEICRTLRRILNLPAI